VELVCAGLSNREIGRRRGTSERTIANQSLHAKLGVRSRLEPFAWRARKA
jgi:DNA-binding CsgD family transcriptional regulator